MNKDTRERTENIEKWLEIEFKYSDKGITQRFHKVTLFRVVSILYKLVVSFMGLFTLGW